MIQAIIKRGGVLPKNVPSPVVSNGGVLIKTIQSCISAGTELTSVGGSGQSLIKRAFKQPEQVSRIFNMFRDDGIEKTLLKFSEKQHQGSVTGYSLAGIIVGVGQDVSQLKPGDRVAAAGAGYANHAQFVDVPQNLVMKIPDRLDFAQASTVALGGIAMQAVRRAKIMLGEYAVVLGAGILGQLAIQILSVAGARVVAIDVDNRRLDIAKSLGAELAINSFEEDPVPFILHATNGYGADVVFFCAATSDEKVLSKAFDMTRKKGRVIMVGVYGDVLRRTDIYRKEIDFLISTSYGPGRYDCQYEEKHLDYPYAYVRWTEKRNMQEYLRLLSSQKINVSPLIEKKYPIDKVDIAFNYVAGPDKPLMVLLDYGPETTEAEHFEKISVPGVTEKIKEVSEDNKIVKVGVIGAGNFAKGTHLPNLALLKKKYQIYAICDKDGANAKQLAEFYHARFATTDIMDIINDPFIDLTMICTRHDSHATLVLQSLQAGKNTFVEKPLCIRMGELEAIQKYYESDQPKIKPILTVGYNRRFSKYITEIKRRIDNRINPLIIYYRMNVGYLPSDHWVHTEEGGGRVVGEACHILDLFSFLVGEPMESFNSTSLTPQTDSINENENKAIVCQYRDGSVATLHYFSIGSKDLEKEYMELHFDNKSIILNNYCDLRGLGIKVKRMEDRSPNKGNFEELERIYASLTSSPGEWPIPYRSLVETSNTTLLL